MDTPLSPDTTLGGEIASHCADLPAASLRAGGESVDKPLPAGVDRAALEREVAAAMSGLDMKEFSAAADQTPVERALVQGDVVKAKVLSCSPRDVLVDLGGKVQGLVPRDEFLPGYEPPAGLEMNVLVEGVQADSGLIKLSKKRADVLAMWRDLKVGDVVEGIVAGMNKGGLEVAVGGIKAFIPSSQVDTHFVKDITELFGKPIKAEVIKIEPQHQNLVISRRKVLERDAANARSRMIDEIKVGELRRGRVRSLTEFGAFIDLGGIDGLLHISDMTWGRIAHVSEMLKVNDEVEVCVLKVQKQKGRLSLGLKQLKPNPWENAAERFPVGGRFKGRILRHADFGLFVELEAGIEGLVPLSELSWNPRIRSPRDVGAEGDLVDVQVLSLDGEKHRISLSIKQLSEDPWKNAATTYPPGHKVKIKVLRLAQFGAFVELEPGVEGMIHISELSQQHVKAVSDVVQPGQEAEARVLRVEAAARRIALSLRPEPAPHVEQPQRSMAETAAPARKTSSKSRRGGLDFEWGGVIKLDPSKYQR